MLAPLSCHPCHQSPRLHRATHAAPPARTWLTGLLALVWCLGGARPNEARAERLDSQDLPCGLVEKDNIHVDGLISDWEGVSPTELPGVPQPGAEPSAGRPLKVRLRCNYDERAMYLLIDVEDDVLVRTRQAGLAEDHVELSFAVPGQKGGVDRLLLFPGVYAQRVSRASRWASGRPLRIVEGEGPAGRARPLSGPPTIEVYDALQKRGYAIELRLPLSILPGYRPGVPLPMAVRVVDVDSRARPVPAAVAETGHGDRVEELSRVLFDDAQAGETALLAALSAGRSDIWWEGSGDIGAGQARLLMIGRSLAMVSQHYGYQDVGLSRADLADPQLVDLGEAGKAVALRVTERGGDDGSREVLRLYRADAKGFQVIFAAEVRKQKGAQVLSTQVSYVRRGRAVDIVLAPRPPVGFTEETFAESPATDVFPIPLPWQAKKVRYVRKAGAYVRADGP